MTVAATSGPSQGWYPDPHDSQMLRWWNGTGWTEFTATLPPAAPAAPEPNTIPASPDAPAFVATTAASIGFVLEPEEPVVEVIEDEPELKFVQPSVAEVAEVAAPQPVVEVIEDEEPEPAPTFEAIVEPEPVIEREPAPTFEAIVEPEPVIEREPAPTFEAIFEREPVIEREPAPTFEAIFEPEPAPTYEAIVEPEPAIEVATPEPAAEAVEPERDDRDPYAAFFSQVSIPTPAPEPEPVLPEPEPAPAAGAKPDDDPTPEWSALIQLYAPIEKDLEPEHVVEAPAVEPVSSPSPWPVDSLYSVVEPEPVIEPEPETIVEPEPVISWSPIVEPEPVVEPEPEAIVEPEPVISWSPIVEPEPEPVISSSPWPEASLYSLGAEEAIAPEEIVDPAPWPQDSVYEVDPPEPTREFVLVTPDEPEAEAEVEDAPTMEYTLPAPDPKAILLAAGETSEFDAIEEIEPEIFVLDAVEPAADVVAEPEAVEVVEPKIAEPEAIEVAEPDTAEFAFRVRAVESEHAPAGPVYESPLSAMKSPVAPKVTIAPDLERLTEIVEPDDEQDATDEIAAISPEILEELDAAPPTLETETETETERIEDEPAADRPVKRRSKKKQVGTAAVVVAAAGAAAATNLVGGSASNPAPTATAAATPAVDGTPVLDKECLKLWNTTESQSAAQLRVTLGQFTGALAQVSRVAPLPGTLMQPDSCGLTVYDPGTDTSAVFVAGVKDQIGYLDVTAYPRAAQYGFPKTDAQANVAIKPDGTIRAL